MFSSHSFWTSSSLDVPAGVTKEEGHTGFLTHLLSAVRSLIFLARMIQPFLFLIDHEVEFCVPTIQSFSTRWAFFFFFFFGEKNPVCRDRTHVPTCHRGLRGTSELPGRPAVYKFFRGLLPRNCTLVHRLRARSQTERQGTDGETACSLHVRHAAEADSRVSVENVF